MIIKDSYYDDRIVFKPWGFEHMLLRIKNEVLIKYLNIEYNKQTSLHSHPAKKTGFIILNGKALVQYGIYRSNNKVYNPLSRLVIRPGLFHSIKAISKKGLQVLELESPVDQNDLIRLSDKYGRKFKSYEGKNFTTKGNNINYKLEINNKKNHSFTIGNTFVQLEKKKNFKDIKKNDLSTSAILKGEIVDKKGQSVIKYGEIVKTTTLKILSSLFRIKIPFLIIRVSQIKKK